MGREIIQAIEQIGKEKGIDRQLLIEAVEAALVSAAKKKLETQENLEAHLDPESGEMELVCLKVVVKEVTDPDLEIQYDDIRKDIEDVEIGDEVEIKIRNFPLGRIAAQTAKQVIMQKVREAERDMVFRFYEDKIGHLVSGRVNRVEKGDIFIDLERGEALLPKREQAPRDFYKKGDAIRVLLVNTQRSTQGTQVIVSRTHPDLLLRLFEVEVPEIAENIVEIIKAEREPGGRAKICVRSNDSNVDPVGACVGIKGSRVQSVVRELKGENIDIIEWTEDPKELITRALNPAVLKDIVLDVDTMHALVTVAEDQLSLAIGKKGQNVRLACRLTGWQIDIESDQEILEETEISGEDQTADDETVETGVDSDVTEPEPEPENGDQETVTGDLSDSGTGTDEETDLPFEIEGVDEKIIRKLVNAGYDSLEKLRGISVEDVMTVSTIDKELAEEVWNKIPRDE